jgi:RES domain
MSFENRICGECVSDPYLQNQIRASAERLEACDYCHAHHPTIELYALAQQCDSVIEHFYDVSSLCDDVVIRERTPKDQPLADLLTGLLGGSESLREDVTELLDQIWFDRDTMESRYGEDPWFEEATRHPEALSKAWQQMERQLRYEARLVNPAATTLLEQVFGSLLYYRTHDGKPVIAEAGPATESNTFFRARVFSTVEDVQTALTHPERHLGPPPQGIGPAGRMNCAGVAVFYGAGDRVTALCEVRPPVGSYVAIGEFKVVQALRLLDLNAQAAIGPGCRGSPFDPATKKATEHGQFLKTLTRTLTMPVVPELQHRDYLITQAIADFLATHPVLQLDGILFPSAQRVKPPVPQQYFNVILFNKAATVAHANSKASPPYGVRLFEYEEGTPHFAPQIYPAAPQPQYPSARNSTSKSPALELNLGTIEIHEIRAVEVTTHSHHVFQHPGPAS